MKKIVDIHIQESIFHIEEDAYQKLEKYLTSIKKHFASYEDSEEITSDIEGRIAEKFATEQLSAKHRILTLKDVSTVIAAMGEVKDIANEERDIEDMPEEPTSKRLYRDPDDMVVAGVASGVAAYFNLSPLLVRVLFLLSVLFGGYGMIIYGVLWVITPLASSPSQKLEMHGDSITLSSLEQNIRKGLDQIPQDKSGLRNFLNTAGTALATILIGIVKAGKVIFIPFIRFIGGIFTFAMSIAILALTFGFISLLFNLLPFYFEPEIREVLSVFDGNAYYAITTSGYLAALIPLIFLAMIGASVALMKNIFKARLVLSLILIGIIALMSFGLLMLRYIPEVQVKAEAIERRLAAEEQANRITKSFPVSDFSGIEAGHANHIILKNGPAYSVTAEGNENVLDTINMDVQNNVLRIKNRDLYANPFQICIFRCGQRSRPTITITTPALRTIELHGATELESADTFDTSSLRLNMHGASRLQLAVNTSDLYFEAHGASQIAFSGTADEITGFAHGASVLDFARLNTANAVLETHGASRVRTHVTSFLRATSHGASQILYSGTDRVDIQEHGAGRVLRSTSPLEEMSPEEFEVRDLETDYRKSFEPTVPPFPATASPAL